MSVTILSLAVFVETLLLVGILTLVVRLRGRVEALRTRETVRVDTTVAQMSMLVEEAQHLSMTIADQLAEHVRVAESIQESSQSITQRPADIAESQSTSTVARRRAPRGTKVATTAEPKASTRSRSTKSTGDEGDTATRAWSSTSDDMQVAREKGMDPIGIALQRSLAERADSRRWPSA